MTPYSQRPFWTAILGGVILGGILVAATPSEENLPKKPDPDMLSYVWKNSPYQKGISSDSTSTQYTLTGMFSIGSQDFVSVLNRTTSDRFTLGKIPDKNNSKLIDLHSSSILKETYATVEIEGTQYKIKYDQTLLAEAPELPATNSDNATNAFRRRFPGGMPPWMTNGSTPPRFFRRQRPIDNTNLQ